MTPRERVWAALAGKPVDRPPISFWGHFYHRESTPSELVEATLEFQNRYRWDWVKLNPRRHIHAEAWGLRYRYDGRPDSKPVRESVPVRTPADWASITELQIDRGPLGEQIEAVRLLKRALPADVPFVQTVFTPFAVLGEMVEAPGLLQLHMGTSPEPMRKALESITRTWERLVPALLEAGADGIFFATLDWASGDLMSAANYKTWARPSDLRVLARAAAAPFNVLHVCKRHNLLLELADYPVQAFSWAATDPSNPTLAAARSKLRGALMGGISHEQSLQKSDPRDVLAEFRRALDQTGGRHWLAAPGCSIPPATPAANLEALRAAADTASAVTRPAPGAA